MRRTTMLLSAAASSAFTIAIASSPAHAWDGAQMWYDAAEGQSPGGGGIFGTGGARDYRVTCLDCHVERAEVPVELQWDISPALGPNETYMPSTQYQFTLTMVGESVGENCGQLMDANNLAVAFEDTQGNSVGSLQSDSGQSAQSCPSAYPDPSSGTTVLYGDCDVIVSQGRDDLTQWTFRWTSPAASGGPVRVFYGAVDGDCNMDSFNDAVVNDSFVMDEASSAATARIDRPSRLRWWLLIAALALAGIAWRERRRWSRA